MKITVMAGDGSTAYEYSPKSSICPGPAARPAVIAALDEAAQFLRRAAMTGAQIKYMVDRFLSWKLPSDFSPDAGISFKATFNDHLPVPTRHQPSGTNLFDARQADAMVRFMIEGMPAAADV